MSSDYESEAADRLAAVLGIASGWDDRGSLINLAALHIAKMQTRLLELNTMANKAEADKRSMQGEVKRLHRQRAALRVQVEKMNA